MDNKLYRKSSWARFTHFGVLRFATMRRTWVLLEVHPLHKAHLAFSLAQRIGPERGKVVPLERIAS